jgi:hypothetical protein
VQVNDPQLERIARGVVWWEAPEATLADQDNFLNRVMARGFWEEMKFVEKFYGEDALRKALKSSKPGVFDLASWHYWHHRLGFDSVPERPARSFE